MFLSLLLLVIPAHAGLDEGRSAYVAKCQACHGATGQGDGPAARALPKKPRDFSQPAYWDEVSETSLRTTILQGKPGSIMRGFPMSDVQLDDLVAFLKSLKVDD